jgi:hypothetical protein
MNKPMTLLILAFAGMTLTAAESLRFADGFEDGNLTDNTRWHSQKSKQPWTVSKGLAQPSGKIIFDSLSTSDFKPIETGAFNLRFTVTFSSAEKTGNNRFSVMLRDSTAGGAGYSATIAQGTANNCGIETINKGARTMIAKMAPKDASYFEPGKPADIAFSRTADGNLCLTVNGVVRMKATNQDFTRFDSVQFTERCKQADMIQGIGQVSLYANEP